MSWILPASNVTATVMSPCLPTPVPSAVTGAAIEAAAKPAAKTMATADMIMVDFIAFSPQKQERRRVSLRPKEKAFGAGRRTGGRSHSPYECVLSFIGGGPAAGLSF